MEEVSVGDLAACRGEGGASMAYIEGRGGFGPFVDEGNDRVATLESLRASLRGLRHMEFDGVASSGCERDSGADASAPSPSWIGTTESGQGVGERGILDSSPRDETTALMDAMLIDLASSVDCDVDSTSLAEAHAQGDPPRIGDTGAHRTEQLSKDLSERCVERSFGERGSPIPFLCESDVFFEVGVSGPVACPRAPPGVGTIEECRLGHVATH